MIAPMYKQLKEDRMVDLNNLKISDCHFEDINNALNNIIRFSGSVPEGRVGLTVAQHTALVVDILRLVDAPPETLMYGLMHDWTETYIGDVIAPVKTPEILELEERIAQTLRLAFFPIGNYTKNAKDAVRWADTISMHFERFELYGRGEKFDHMWPAIPDGAFEVMRSLDYSNYVDTYVDFEKGHEALYLEVREWTKRKSA